jgi:hypothetical protein
LVQAVVNTAKVLKDFILFINVISEPVNRQSVPPVLHDGATRLRQRDSGMLPGR